jgi:hypothetical protein
LFETPNLLKIILSFKKMQLEVFLYFSALLLFLSPSSAEAIMVAKKRNWTCCHVACGIGYSLVEPCQCIKTELVTANVKACAKFV